MASRLSPFILGLVLGACMPAPVKAVDGWLTAFSEGRNDEVVARTVARDRPLLVQALAALEEAPTSTLALALPPRPVSHAIIEIVDKSEDRQVIATRLTVPNPLASASKRVGQPLPNLPQTREVRRRFLSVREGKVWTVQLDLQRVTVRANYAAELLRLIAEGQLERAEQKLNENPPSPPDDGNAQEGEDRLVAELKQRLVRERNARTDKTKRR